MSTLWPSSPPYISKPPSAGFINKKRRSLVILGSTGSIGRAALSAARQERESLNILALGGGRNVELLASQALEFRPPFLAIIDEDAALRLAALLPDSYRPKILAGRAGYAAIASLQEADCVLSAQVGASALAGTLAAALAGKTLALANKESLVIAGPLLRKICAAANASILPVDSEHYAIFQCAAGRSEDVERLILTASGGPFRGKSREFLLKAGPADALKHPSWNMGAKITIDSATLMNKGLEIVEAVRLYGLPQEKIEVLVHPGSIVHSLAQFKDNSMLAQLACPDMRLPIAACLLWPRCRKSFIKPLDLAALGSLLFEKADVETFPCIALARKALAFESDENWREWGLDPACIVLNAANEAAVELFLQGKCGFCQIAEMVEAALDKFVFANPPKAPPYPALSGSDIIADAMALAAGMDSLDKACRCFVAARFS